MGPAKQLAEKIQELLNAIGIIGIPPMEELMNKLERKNETGDANMKLQIAVVKKFAEIQAEEKQRADEKKRQEAEAQQQPAQSQPTGTSWGWLGSALSSIKTALTTPLSRKSRTVKKDDSSSDSSSSTEDNTPGPSSGPEEGPTGTADSASESPTTAAK